MLDEIICHIRGVSSLLSLLLYFFFLKILLANILDPDQTPHHVASDLGLHCLHMTLLRIPGKNGLIKIMHTLASLLLPCLADYGSKCGSELNVRCLPRPAHHILLSFFVPVTQKKLPHGNTRLQCCQKCCD